MLRLVSFAKKETPLLGGKKEPAKAPARQSFDAESGVLWKDGVLRSLQPGQRFTGPPLAADQLQTPVDTACNGRIQRPRAKIPGGGDPSKAGNVEDVELADAGGEDEFVLVDALSPRKVDHLEKRRSSGGLGERSRIAGSLWNSDLLEDENGWPANGRWIKTAEEEAEDLRKDIDKLASQLAAKEQELAKAMKHLAAAEGMASAAPPLQAAVDKKEAEIVCLQEKLHSAEKQTTQLQAVVDSLKKDKQRLEEDSKTLASRKQEGRGTEAQLRAEIDRLKVEVSAKAKESSKASVAIEQMKRDLQQKTQQAEQLGKELKQVQKELRAERKTSQDKDSKIQGLEGKLADMEQGIEKRQAEVNKLKQQVSIKGEEALKTKASLDETKSLVSSAETKTNLLKEQIAAKDKELVKLQEDLKTLETKAGKVREAEDASQLKVAVQEKDDLLRGYQAFFKEVQEILVQLGYEKEGREVSDSSSGKRTCSQGLSDLEKAGKCMMKHCATVKELKKQHELAQELSRGTVMNLQQEVEEFKKSLAEKDRLCSELKAKVAIAASKGSDDGKMDGTQATGLKGQAADGTPTMENATPGCPSPAWQQTVPTKDEFVTSPLGVRKSAGEKAKATDNVLMQRVAATKPGVGCAAFQDGPEENMLGSGIGKDEKENGLDLAISDSQKPVAEALAVAAAAALEKKGQAASGPGKKKKKGRAKH